MDKMETKNKFKIVKYFKGKKIGELPPYSDEQKANEVCNYMNKEIKKITEVVKFKVEKI